jgi:hypothetical protein
VRVLLDECVPRKLRRELPEHEVRTVTETGWNGTKNGALLALAAQQFDVFLTVDSNLQYQQNLMSLPISVIVMLAHSNDVDVLRPLMPRVRDVLDELEPGRLYHIQAGE